MLRTVGAAVVAARDGAEALLTSRVPDLRMVRVVRVVRVLRVVRVGAGGEGGEREREAADGEGEGDGEGGGGLSCSLMVLPSSWMVRILKSTPIVEMWLSVYVSSAKRSSRQDLPTPESPISTSLKT